MNLRIYFLKVQRILDIHPWLQWTLIQGIVHQCAKKPYSLPLKHVEWVQKELEILERAGVIQRSMSPMGKSHSNSS